MNYLSKILRLCDEIDSPNVSIVRDFNTCPKNNCGLRLLHLLLLFAQYLLRQKARNRSSKELSLYPCFALAENTAQVGWSGKTRPVYRMTFFSHSPHAYLAGIRSESCVGWFNQRAVSLDLC